MKVTEDVHFMLIKSLKKLKEEVQKDFKVDEYEYRGYNLAIHFPEAQLIELSYTSTALILRIKECLKKGSFIIVDRKIYTVDMPAVNVNLKIPHRSEEGLDLNTTKFDLMKRLHSIHFNVTPLCFTISMVP